MVDTIAHIQKKFHTISQLALILLDGLNVNALGSNFSIACFSMVIFRIRLKLRLKESIDEADTITNSSISSNSSIIEQNNFFNRHSLIFEILSLQTRINGN